MHTGYNGPSARESSRPRMVIFSDLHGNDAALEQLLARETGTIVSAGDVLGTHGSNLRCLELMREGGIPSVQGNHEQRMLKIYQPGLDEWACDWIIKWPMELIDAEALVTHTLFEGGDFYYIEQPEQALRLQARRPLVFTGHIHHSGYWEGTRWRSVHHAQQLTLQPDQTYLIQIGSLGDRVGRYVVWTPGQVEWVFL